MEIQFEDAKGVANPSAGNKPVDINVDTKTCAKRTCEEDSIPGSKRCWDHSGGHNKRTEQDQRAAEAANL